ncbi:hypothetical protein AB8B21_05680 [Tardiphaga sp. 866_E4_N2_1]|uniref:hypothetical protein n=1 Tax=unclassified Tardiphaga TaxID=2631404 RepID=UPI003F1EAAB6
MRNLIATKPFTYATRRLKAGDGFIVRSEKDSRVLVALGKAKAGVVKPEVDGDDADLRSMRAEYERVLGKKPYHGWTSDQLLEKIVATQAGE